MIRKRKKFAWPKKLYDKPRIIEENKLLAKYGLKNKREVWKSESKIKYFRTRAKGLITAEQEEQQKFFDKLNKIGLKVENISDVLALKKEDLLKRRLPSVLIEKNLANAPKQARQMVVHKRVMIKNKVVNVPSYLVSVDEENLISIRKKVRKPRVQQPKQPEGEENVAGVSEKEAVVEDNVETKTEEMKPAEALEVPNA